MSRNELLETHDSCQHIAEYLKHFSLYSQTRGQLGLMTHSCSKYRQLPDGFTQHGNKQGEPLLVNDSN